MSKKILYIDMDGVIADFIGEMAIIAPYLDLGEGPDYEERGRQLRLVCADHPTIFHDLKPIDGAIEAVKDLYKHFDIYFLSTPMWSLPESYSGKRIWLEKHFGHDAFNRLILTCRKDLNIGDFLVDDSTRNGAGQFKGEHIHFGSGFFPTWKETKDYLIKKV